MVGTLPRTPVAETSATTRELGPTDAGAQDQRPRLAIVVPVFQGVYPAPFANFLRLTMRAAHVLGDRYGFDVHVPERQLLHGAMNDAFQTVLDKDYAAVILMDDDCFAPADAIERLVAHWEQGAEFVAGVGFMRNYPHTTTVGTYYPEGPSLVPKADGTYEWIGFQWWDDIGTMQRPLQRVDFCGFPIALISRTAIQKMRAPWFGMHMDGGDCTHDVYFAKKATDAGVALWVDPEIQCGHLSPTFTVTFENRDVIRRGGR